MNKIYKVIWSKVKACYVVVSELAKRHSKGKSLKSAASLVALTAILAFLPVQVNATDVAPRRQHCAAEGLEYQSRQLAFHSLFLREIGR